MEFSYSIDSAGNLILARVWSEITVDGMIDLVRRMGRDERFRQDMHLVIDLRETSADWDYSDVQRYRDYLVHVARGPKRRWAVVVAPGAVEAIVHLIIIISEAMHETVQMRGFRDPRQARDWVTGDEPDPL